MIARRISLYIGCLMLLCTMSVDAELYKWVDERGNTHYTDTPPPASAKQQDIPQLPSLNGYTSAPIEARDNSYRHRSKTKAVVMYGTAWCGYCKKARRYFEQNNIAFREYDIETSRSANRRFKSLGGKGVPLIVVGKQQMSGFSVAQFNTLYSR